MPMTFLSGQQNLAALQVPGVYIDIVPPQPFLNGAPTNYMGLVGVASWGPTNSPVPFSGPDSCSTTFGVPQIRKYDLASWVWASSQVGSSIGYYGVRVTDGTDVAASAAIQSNCLTVTAKYTGTLGNSIRFQIGAGSQANTKMVIVSFPGRPPEIFNNIAGTGNAFWVAVAAAINSGNATRGPSRYVTATAGAGTTTPTLGTASTLSGGTDGASISDSTLLGLDTVPRKGMYALRNTGVDGFALCDHSDSSSWAAIDSFALSENCFFATSTVSGDTISNAVSTRNSAGLDDYFTWLAVGDFPTFYDTQNKVNRQISPAAFMIGWAGNASPEQSPLNKPLRGVTATQNTVAAQTYSDTELAVAQNGGVDIIVGPPTTPGGNYFTFITGRNASSNTSANGLEWTRMTNFLARSFRTQAAGQIVGRLQSNRPDDRTRADAKALVDGFLASLKDPAVGSRGNGLIEDFATVCDLSNNPLALQQRGFLFIYVAVKYFNVVRYFVIKLAGGGTVSVTSQSTPADVAQFL